MDEIKPYSKNAPGDFIVENGHCIQCCAPQAEAPDLMDNDGISCYFKKQPLTPDEVDRAIEAVCVSCCGAVRYVGNDIDVSRRIKEFEDEMESNRLKRDRENAERLRHAQAQR